MKKPLDHLRRFFSRASKANPLVQVDALIAQGHQFEDENQLEEALSCYRASTRLAPLYPRAYLNVGNALLALKGLDEAVASYREAIRLDPYFAQAHFNLGLALERQEQPTAALAAYRKALSFDPYLRDAPYTFAHLLMEMEQYPEAITVLEGALVDDTESGRLKWLLARALNLEAHSRVLGEAENGDSLANAERLCRKAIELDPGYPEAYHQLALILTATLDVSGAENAYRKAIALRPDYGSAQNNLGHLLLGQARPDEAEACFRAVLAVDPDNATAQWNLSYPLLLRGNYEEGWKYYEKRFQCVLESLTNDRHYASLPAPLEQLSGVPRWEGQNLGGKSLLVWMEQGLGDNIMMIRYLPLLRRAGVVRLVVHAHPPLLRIMQSLGYVDVVAGTDTPLPGCETDLHCPMMSFPHLFHTRLDTIPGQAPYLSAPSSLVAHWAARLENGPVRVGLVWGGNRATRQLANRSIPLQKFKPLLGVGGARFISLQKGPDARQLAELRWDIDDWMDECEDLMDTAALMENLDVVISIDTAVAHLAGALGKTVWLLNRYESDWRWGLGLEHSPWYPSMRIFSQSRLGDWDSVIRRVAEELARMVNAGSMRQSFFLHEREHG